MNKELNIIHLELKQHQDGRPNHFYFGCMSAIYNMFDAAELGIAYNSLRRKKVDEATGVLYDGVRCTIRKGTVITAPKRRKIIVSTDNMDNTDNYL